MGSSQSKVPAAVHANMLSEFEAMRTKDMDLESESDFVYVAEEQRAFLFQYFTHPNRFWTNRRRQPPEMRHALPPSLLLRPRNGNRI